MKHFKVLAVAQMLGTTVDSVRRAAIESKLDIARQENGPKTRLYSIRNVFEIARFMNSKSKAVAARPKAQRVVVTYAPKGGVGKTTLCSNLACEFALSGYSTLVIDLDFQSNLTLCFGYDSELTVAEAREAGVDSDRIVEYHFGHLTPSWPGGRRSLKEVVKMPYGPHGPHLVPADLTLDRLDAMLMYEALEGNKPDSGITRLLRDGLTGREPHFDLSAYDIILFDAAPAKNRMTRAALLAADYVVSPVSMEKFSTKALSYLSSVLDDMEKDFSRSPELIVVGNFFDPSRVRVVSQMAAITKAYEHAWLERTIRRSEDFPKSLSGEIDLPLVLSKPSSDSAHEIRGVAKALLTKMGVAASA